MLSVLPPRGGKALCYELPSALLNGTTLVLDEAAPTGVSRPPGLGRIVRTAPAQLYDSATIEMLSHCEISLLAVEEADRISQWSPRYSPSYHAIPHAVEQVKPSITLALCSAAPRDVQGDIMCQLGMLDAHRVSGPLCLDGLFVEARAFDSPRARLDAIADGSRASDGGVCVIVPEAREVSPVSSELAARGVPVGHDDGTVVAAAAELDRAAGSKASRVIFAYRPASLDEWLLRIGSLAGSRPTVASLYIVGSDGLRQGAAAGGVSVDDILSVHTLIVDRSTEGVLSISEGDLSDLSRLPPDRLAHVLAQLEGLGAIVRRPDPRDRVLNLRVKVDSLSQGSAARIDQHLARLRQHAAHRAEEVAEFARARTCRRELLAEAAGLSKPDVPCSLCDNCAPDLVRSASRQRQAAAVADQPAPENAEELVLECVGKLPLGVDKAQLVELLSGTIPSRIARQIDRDDFLGALEVLGGPKVRETVESMIAVGALVERKIVVADKTMAIVEAADSGSGPGLGAQARSGKAAELEPSAPSLRAVDFDLLTRLKDWRGEIAHRRRIRPSEVVLDSDLRVMAQMKPLTVQELRDCVGMSWQRVKRWAQQILRLVRSEEPVVLPPTPEVAEEPQSVEGLMASLNTDDPRAKLDAIRALKAIADPRSLEALEEISLDITEPMLVRLYAGIAKRAVLASPRQDVQPVAEAAQVSEAEAAVTSGSLGEEGLDRGSSTEMEDFKLRYPT